MNHPLKASAQQVQATLEAKGFSFLVKELPASTRSAQEAADAIGCQVAEIAKSIVFRTVADKKPLLVIASGINRIEIALIEKALGGKIEQPEGKWVKETLGFAIGGIPPLGYAICLPVFIDEDLFGYEEIWAAAGTPNAVFCLPSKDLITLTQGEVIRVY